MCRALTIPNIECRRSLQCRVESALSTTEKLWKEQHLSELAKLQIQLQSQQRDCGERVEVAVNEARERWEREHEGKIEEAVGLAKQVFYLHCHLVSVPLVRIACTCSSISSNSDRCDEGCQPRYIH